MSKFGTQIKSVVFAVGCITCAATYTPVLFAADGDDQYMDTVYVNGQIDCYGKMSARCGFDTDALESWATGVEVSSYDGEGGGGGGGVEVSESDDGSKGRTMDHRRQPGCAKEDLLLEQLTTALKEDSSPGVYINVVIGDPVYSGGNWELRQYNAHQHLLNPPNFLTKTIWQQNIHFMYNRVTAEVAQLKFVNSYEYGCKGIEVSQ